MEEQVIIQSRDSVSIHGIKNTPADSAGAGLIIFVHGFTGNKNTRLIFNTKKFFPKKGCYTYRFDLYNTSKDARDFLDTSVRQNSQDIEDVISYFKSTYKKVYLVGHSLAIHAFLMADLQKIDAVIFWDGSYSTQIHKSVIWKDFIFNKEADAYVMPGFLSILVGKKLYTELQEFPNSVDLISKIKRPIKIIVASDGLCVDAGKDYFKHAHSPKDFCIIHGASHNFDEGETEEELYKATLDWVKKF